MNEPQRFDMADVSVQIGVPVMGQFPPQTTIALVDTCCALKDRGIPFELKLQVGCSIIEQARTFVCDEFLKSDSTHLFMIDADISWKADDFLRLLALGTKMECVTGIYPSKRDPETWMLNTRGRQTMNQYGCLPVDGAGLGFCCIQRGVIEELADKAPKLRFADRPHLVAHLFRCDTIDGHFRGEDMAFFADVAEAGYNVWLDPAIELGHVGVKEYRGSFLEAIRERKVSKEKAEV